jgi:EmrB/QacA subfamily drug resistance transporter
VGHGRQRIGLRRQTLSEASGVSAQPAGGTAAGDRGFLTHKQIMIILPGLLMAMMLAMLDQLVVSTALPRIVGDLGGVSHLSWVVTAYILASTITTPFYGKLGDMYGRKKFFIAAIVIFLVGSALSGLSQSMVQLITFRALQGLGAGGLMVGAMATLGEIVPPRERGKYMSYFMVVMMLATIGGPLVGGWITEAFSWRWIFYINLPLGGAALVYLTAVMKLPARRVEHRIDYLGGILLGVVATAIILLATLGGTEYGWTSPQIIGLLVLAIGGLLWWMRTERRAAEPMLPLHVFKNRNFSVTMVLTFFVGLALFGAMTFLPLYQQTVQGADPTVSGLLMTPLMVGSMVTSVVAGFLVSKTGRYRAFPIVGGAVMTVGMLLLTRLGVATPRLTTGIDYVVLGLGMGCLMQMMSLIAQNSVDLKDQGVASSARMFFQQMGGSLGVAAFGALFARKLDSVMSAAGSVAGSAHLQISGGSFDPAQVASLPPAVQHVIFEGVSKGVSSVFIAVLPASILVFVLAWFIKEVPLRTRADAGGEEAPVAEAEALIG